MHQEREQLAQQLAQAQASERAKVGEVAIVRKNLNNKIQEHIRVVQSLQKLHAEEKAKHAIETENLKAEMEKVRTDTMFLQKEVEEVAKRNKLLESDVKKGRRPPSTMELQFPSQSTGREAAVHPSSSRIPRKPATPKKRHKGYGLRDGFDDDEIMIGGISPSKQRTPTKSGAKRKRSFQESPVPELHLSSPRANTPQLEESMAVDDMLLDKLMIVDDSGDVCEDMTLSELGCL